MVTCTGGNANLGDAAGAHDPTNEPTAGLRR